MTPEQLQKRIDDVTDMLERVIDWYESRSESFRKRTNRQLWYRAVCVLHTECNWCALQRMRRKAVRLGWQITQDYVPGKQCPFMVFLHPRDAKKPTSAQYMECVEEPKSCKCDIYYPLGEQAAELTPGEKRK